MSKIESCNPNVFDERTLSDISRKTRDVIRTVTADANTFPVGTFKYRVFLYPGDIDIYERLGSCCTFTQAKVSATISIQNIVRKITNTPGIIFSDFKAGYDLRFKIYTGTIVSDGNGGMIAKDFNVELVRRDVNALKFGGLLRDDEYNYIMMLLSADITLGKLMEIDEFFRNLWVVRWTAAEILQGYKILRGNYVLYLDVALSQGSIVKIDVITFIDDRYTEVTNFFYIRMIDEYGNEVVLSKELVDYQQSLLADFNKYYGNNTLKALKRLWLYLAYVGKSCEVALFNELFSSEIALYAQVASDVEVAINLLKSNLDYDRALLFSSLTKRFQLLNNTCHQIYAGLDTDDISVIIGTLERLYDCIISQTNELTLQWLQQRNINPPLLIGNTDL